MGGDAGCWGGTQEEAYKYYENGIDAELESVYPYTSAGGMSGDCKYDPSSTTAVTVLNYILVAQSNMA